MKILYITNMYPSEKRIYDGIFIKEQIEFCQEKYGFNYEVYEIERFKNKYKNYVKSIFEINRLIHKEKFDLIHIHFGLSGLFLLFHPFLKTPTILTLHGSDILSYKRAGLIQKISKLAVSRTTCTIILNDKMLDILKKYKSKLIKIPCGIDIKAFDLERANGNNEKFVIGFPSSKERKVKNYPLFKKITDTLIEKGYSVKIVEFRDFTRKQVAENLCRLDCLLLTSHSECSPQIIKEAMAAGVPIVASNVGDVAYLLEGVRNCSIVKTFDADDFIKKIIEIINLPKLERTTNGKEKIKSMKFDQDSVSANIYELYLQLTK